MALPSFDTCIRLMTAAGEIMLGRKPALGKLDLSADGFYDSFFALIVALPPMLLSWVTIARRGDLAGETGITVTGMVARLAFIDVALWLLPLFAFIAVARFLGLTDRIIAYVAASNWASALIVWLTVPLTLLDLLVAQNAALDALQFMVFIAILVLSFRLTVVTLNRPLPLSGGVFAASLVFSIVLLMLMRDMLGLAPS